MGYPDFEGQKSKLFTVADWAAVEATDINLTAAVANVLFGFGVLVIYLVPAAQTLYITQISFSSRANLAASGDLPQICQGQLFNVTTGIFLYRQGGNGGGGRNFAKPIVIPGGETLDVIVINYANHACDVEVHAGGYLV